MDQPALRLIHNAPTALPGPVIFDRNKLSDQNFNENDIFQQYLSLFSDIIKCALVISTPSSYMGTEEFLIWPFNQPEEPQYGQADVYANIDERISIFYNIHSQDFKLEDLMALTGLHLQQAKSFAKVEMRDQVKEILNCFKKSLKDFNAFIKLWNQEIRKNKTLFYELTSSVFQKTKSILAQIYHNIVFLLLWSSRYFMSTSYLHFQGLFQDQVTLFERQTMQMEEILASFVDGILPESQAEKKIKMQINTLYDTWIHVIKYYNTLVSFGHDLEYQPGQKIGFHLHPDHDVGFALSRMWKTRALNSIERITNIHWTGGEAVLRSMIDQNALEEIIESSMWLGKKFALELDDSYQDRWKDISMDTMAQYDLSEITTITKLIKDLRVEKSELLVLFSEPSFELPRKTRTLPDNSSRLNHREMITEDEIYENQSSSSRESNLPSHSTSIQQTQTTNIEECLPSSNVDRVIKHVRRILKRVQEISNDGSKVSEDFKKAQIQKAMETLDKLAESGSDTGSPSQWCMVEDLYFEVDQVNKENLTNLEKLEKKANNKHQLPKAHLSQWSGDASDFLEFRAVMTEILDNYNDENLKLSTLRAHIVGKDKSIILSRIRNAKNLEDAFIILNTFYGDFDVILPMKRRVLEDLPNNPTFAQTESKSIEAILDYLNLLSKHNKEHLVDSDFVNIMQHKLSLYRKNELRDKMIHKFDEFKEFLLKVQRTNMNLSLTDPAPAGVSRRRGMNLNATSQEEADDSNDQGSCLACKAKHHKTHQCSLIKSMPKVEERIDFLMKNKICLKCLCKWKKDHKCNQFHLSFLCKCKRKINKHICNPCKPKEMQANSIKCGELGTKSSINGTSVGGVGFLSESINLVDNEGNVKSEIVCYDSYSSHTIVSEALIKSLKTKITRMEADVTTKTFCGAETERGRKAVIRVKSNDGIISFEAMVKKKCKNDLTPVLFEISTNLSRKYDLPGNVESVSGSSSFLIGLDKPELYPDILEVSDGIMIAKSRITNNILVAGRGETLNKDRNCPDTFKFDCNKSVSHVSTNDKMMNNSFIQKATTCSIKNEDLMESNPDPSGPSSNSVDVNPAPDVAHVPPGPVQKFELDTTESETGSRQVVGPKTEPEPGSEPDNSKSSQNTMTCNCNCIHANVSQSFESQVMKQFSSDSLNISAIKHCFLCRNCPNCSNMSLDKPRDLEQMDLIKKIEDGVTWNEEQRRYSMAYPHNQLIGQLPTYEGMSKKIMMNLERKLKKAGLLEKFNTKMTKLKNEGVYIPVSKFPELEKMQKSFICLTYSLNKIGADGEPSLRICSNSSLGQVSFNDTCVPCPSYLEKLDSILTKWRTHKHYAFSDVTSCYTNVLTSMEDSSLRRVWLREGDLGDESSPWIPYITARAMFGDKLAGAGASVCIQNTIKEKVDADTAQLVKELTMMDDLALGMESLPDLHIKKQLIEDALTARQLPLKEWTISGQDHPPVKYLNYTYHPSCDSFSVKLKVNLSESKRGKRLVPDVISPDQVESHVEKFPWTRRNLCSVTLQFSDPLGLLSCYQNNYKFLLRKVIESGLEWDQELCKSDSKKATFYSKLMLSASHILFPRQCLFMDSVRTTIDFYHDSSLSGISVICAVLSEFEDNSTIYRVLKMKSKLASKDQITICRGELTGMLLSTRILNVVRSDLSRFIRDYQNEIKFRIIGDSTIVLNQIHKQYYYFKTWTSARIFEIQSLLGDIKQPVDLCHIRTHENYSDLLTREFTKDPSEIPWTKDLVVPQSISVFRPSKDSTTLPEMDKSKVTVINKNVISAKMSGGQEKCSPESNLLYLGDILSFAIHNEENHAAVSDSTADVKAVIGHSNNTVISEAHDVSGSERSVNNDTILTHSDDTANEPPVDQPDVSEQNESEGGDISRDDGNEDDVDDDYDLDIIIQRCLERCSRYQVSRNAIARILSVFSKLDWNIALEKAEMLIFRSQQQKVMKKIKKFKGNEFYIEEIEGVIFVRGRKTIFGDTRLFLVPPDTLLRDRLLYSYHIKQHSKSVYLRGQLLRDGYYVTTAVTSMKKLTKNCSFCRKRDSRTLQTEMGRLGVERLATGRLFETLQSDVCGPFYCTPFVNQRGPKRKIYLLVSICEFSRYIIVHILQSLSSHHLLEALEYMTYRYGAIRKIKSDMGGNYVGAAASLQQQAEQESETITITENDLSRLKEEALSRFNIQFEFRVSHASFIQGGAERAVSLVKKCLYGMKTSQNLHQWFLTVEKIESFINQRPISLSSSLEILSPCDINSLKSKIVRAENIEEFIHYSDMNTKMFCEKWKDLYFNFLFRQKKWTESSEIKVDSIVIIMDLLNDFRFPSLGKIVKIEKGRDGADRYFHVMHKTKQNRTKILKRAAQSLCLILEGPSNDNIVEVDVPTEDDNNEFSDENIELDDMMSQMNQVPDNFSSQTLDQEPNHVPNQADLDLDEMMKHMNPASDDISSQTLNQEPNDVIPQADPQNDEDGEDLERIQLSFNDDYQPVVDAIQIPPPVRVIIPQNIPPIKNARKRSKKKQQVSS